MKCPVCLSKDVDIIWEFNNIVPVSNFIYCDKEKALNIRLGNIDLTFCHECGFIYNSSFSEDLCDYNFGDYDNDQTENKYFNQYLDDLVDELSEKYNLDNKSIVEIGCGNGKFHKKFNNSVCTGINPALNESYYSKENNSRFEHKVMGQIHSLYRKQNH